MKVLVTGATGFIGSHVVRIAIKEGHEVFVAHQSGTDTWRIKDLLSLLNLIPGDLPANENLISSLERIRPELCIHMAWYAEPGKYLTAPENVFLVGASLELAYRLAQLGCRRFIGMGTCIEYDTRFGYLSEDTPTRPDSLYAASKFAVQTVLARLSEGMGMESAWVRLFYLYGPFEDSRRLVPTIVRSLLSGNPVTITAGNLVRDFLHVEDVAAAIWAVACSNVTGAVNVGSGKPVSIKEVAMTAGNLIGRPELIKVGETPSGTSEPPFICAIPTRLKTNTDWSPRYDLESGLRQTITWWQSQE